MNIKQLEKALSELSGNAYPVDKWQPNHSSVMDMTITQNGQWFHEGDVITRDKLVVLFSKILTKRGNGYYLVTPAERVEITVEDAPFLVVDFDIEAAGTDEQVVWLITNIGDRLPLSSPYEVELRGQEQRPYVTLWRGLDALIERNTYYQLIDCATVNENAYGKSELLLQSKGQSYSLGVF